MRPRLVGYLDELRLVVTEEWLACEVAAGRHVEALPELTRLAAAHPTREGLLGLSMRALDGAGRSLEALAVYRRHQQRLAQEFGLDPGPELQRLHLAVLRGQPRRRLLRHRRRTLCPRSCRRPCAGSSAAATASRNWTPLAARAHGRPRRVICDRRRHRGRRQDRPRRALGAPGRRPVPATGSST